MATTFARRLVEALGSDIARTEPADLAAIMPKMAKKSKLAE